MTDSTDPRWVATYRRAGSPNHETITVQASDIVAAVKAARAQLDLAAKQWKKPQDDALAEARPYTLWRVEEMTDDTMSGHPTTEQQVVA